MTGPMMPAPSLTWPVLVLAMGLAWRTLSTVGSFLWVVVLVLFWEVVGRLQPPPSSRCVQCGTSIRSRRPRCEACSPRS
jgi:hypothetical protein